jgi:hypothetical protein
MAISIGTLSPDETNIYKIVFAIGSWPSAFSACAKR